MDVKQQQHARQQKIEYYFPVQRNDRRKNSYMFPYIKNAEVYREDEKLKVQEIIERIKGVLNTDIPINFNHIHSIDIRDTALNMEKILIDFHFQYIHIYPISAFFKSYLHKIISKKYEYKSIQELKEDEATLLNNTIAIKAVEQNLYDIKQSMKLYSDRKTGVVWNIDKTCGINCSICAYGSAKTHKISLVQKKKIIDAMSELDVDNIDFAVGSGADIEELKKIIQYTRDKYPRLKIKLTATADILSQIEMKFFKMCRIEIDITYDHPIDIDDSSSVRPISYSKENINYAKLLVQEQIPVHAHVVIHEQNINIEHLQSITDKLIEVGIDEILYLRLMPVGKLKLESYPNSLIDSNSYEGLLSIVNRTQNAVLHCALQGLNNSLCPCQLGCMKLGISSNGDVFTCPWAEHLNVVNKHNPFFVGNIISSNYMFINMLSKSESFSKTMSYYRDNQPHCKIFAYLNGGNPYENKDPLYLSN